MIILLEMMLERIETSKCLTLDNVASFHLPPAFEYTACDPSGECDAAPVTVTINPNNNDP